MRNCRRKFTSDRPPPASPDPLPGESNTAGRESFHLRRAENFRGQTARVRRFLYM